MESNEILREVWAIKDAIAEEFGGDVGALMDDARKQQAYWEAKGFRFVSPGDAKVGKPRAKNAKSRPAFRGGTKKLRKN